MRLHRSKIALVSCAALAFATFASGATPGAWGSVGFSIPLELAGCHTAVTGGYLIEGHVPLEALAQLLRDRPQIRGIALPGMPSGTPGMPGAHATTRVVVLDAPHRVYYTG